MILLAVPKSGTEYVAHLLGISEFIGWEADFTKYYWEIRASPDKVYGHIPHTPAIEYLVRNRIKVFLYRDPRDCVVSWFHWAECSFEEALRKVKYRMMMMLPWENEVNHVIRYEDLMLKPKEVLEPLVYLQDDILERIGHKAETFRKGSIGDWVDYFSPRHVSEYLEMYAPLRHWEYK